MNVTYLGPSGTFTHQAVVALRPDAEAVPVADAAEALGAVESGQASYAVLPIDNSVNGVVVPTLDGLLARPGLSIVDSVVLPISFDAYSRDPSVPPHVVVSHPHGLAQCRRWIEEQGLTTREASSTAAACRDLGPGEIGIGARICGQLYDLHTVAEGVEDNSAAFTQFALVSASRLPVRADGDDGLLVSLFPDTNVPGILRRLLGVLEERGVNMTNLVTRPVPATPGIFVFLLFLSGSFTADDFEAMSAEWAALGATARALGRISPLHELAAKP
ncbi:prephenate dehydratase domain-containing protein [Nocardioides sp.]|uniref:prephenate dehydratase n=1 Tax=Nocardioides sp. TaxID=35761 RepID=UPI00271C16E4|nr:prephenate dehydratase domain-containing protein [Nocardioides sp.]MDO9457955.1 prephenate dehydratase domain-containing protein [Nocardioides sp.]